MSPTVPSLVQTIDYVAIAPALIAALAAVAVLVLDALVPDRRGLLAGISLAAVVGGLAWLPVLAGEVRATFCAPGPQEALRSCSYVVNDVSLVFQAVVLGGALVVLLLSPAVVAAERLPAAEYHFLLLCSVAGALTLAAARDLVTLVVALEVVSLPVFALVGLRRGDGRSSEAALKMFLVSVVATALMLFGISLVYGVTGAVHLDRIAAALGEPTARLPVTSVGVVLTVVGLGFKVAAVPFHAWVPDTYAGAPLPVAAYLSVVSKAAGVVGLLLVLGLGFRPYADVWGPLLAVLAALTMSVGNLVALWARSAIRLLAWSTIAQAGYILVPLGVAATAQGRGAVLGEALAASVAYLCIYAVMNLGAFAVVVVVARHRPANRLADYRGLGRTEPVSALLLAFFLACLAGLPPGLVGLFAKVTVFRAAVEGGVGWLAVVMAVNTVVALAYYLVWAALLFSSPAAGAPPPSYRIPTPAALAMGLTLGLAVLLSLAPQLVLGVLDLQAALLG